VQIQFVNSLVKEREDMGLFLFEESLSEEQKQKAVNTFRTVLLKRMSFLRLDRWFFLPVFKGWQKICLLTL